MTPWTDTGEETWAVSPVRFHIEQAIAALRKELETVPPFSVNAQTRTMEICQLIDMLDRRRDRPHR